MAALLIYHLGTQQVFANTKEYKRIQINLAGTHAKGILVTTLLVNSNSP